MYLQGQMNLKSFLRVEILKMDPNYEVFTFDQMQYLGVGSAPEEISLQELKACSLELNRDFDQSPEGFHPF